MTNTTTSKRSYKCVERFVYLLCALNIEKEKNEKGNSPLFRWGLITALQTRKKELGRGGVGGIGENKALPHRIFHSPRQTIFPVIQILTDESIDAYYTRLLAQIIQGRSSYRIKRKALQENYTLKQLLDKARAKEMTDTRIAEIVKKKKIPAPWLPKIAAVSDEEETGVTNPNIATQFSVTPTSFTIQPANIVMFHRLMFLSC